jgi:diacylglycerol kinase family enzyme
VTDAGTGIVSTAHPQAPPAPAVTTLTALVANPTKVPDLGELRATITARCHELGLPPLTVYETTVEDPGVGPARAAVAAGATLVLAAGGDGTVRAVAEGLCGTGVPLGVLPQGTGNLLARNLDLPVDAVEALDVALTGADRRIDVGRLAVEEPEGAERVPGSHDPTADAEKAGAAQDAARSDEIVFTIMAGAGFDAAMMRDAPEGLKDTIGWPAYLLGGLRGMRRRHLRVEVSLDGGPPRRATVRTVLIGNLGQLQAGMELLPDARPDDGLLDVALVAPRRPTDWVVLVARGLLRRHRPDHRLQTFQAREVAVRMDGAHPRQVDGDLIADGSRLSARVEPGALLVRVARDALDDAQEESS